MFINKSTYIIFMAQNNTNCSPDYFRTIKINELLPQTKKFLDRLTFKKLEVFVERALDPNIIRYKYPYYLYRLINNYAKNDKDNFIIQELFSNVLYGTDINYIHSYCLTAQEHYLIGSTPPFALALHHPYKPIQLFNENKKFKSYEIKKFRKNIFVTYTNFGNFFGYGIDLRSKYFFLLEDLDSNNNTLRDPRLINIEKLENLIFFEKEKFDKSSLDDIYYECKMEFKYSADFPFLRNL